MTENLNTYFLSGSFGNFDEVQFEKVTTSLQFNLNYWTIIVMKNKIVSFHVAYESGLRYPDQQFLVFVLMKMS
jgi:hypothetical protein